MGALSSSPGFEMVLPAWLAGHFVADFVLQTRGMAERKRTARGLATHGAVVFAAQAFFLLPFLSTRVALALVGVVATHLVVDRLKIAHAQRRGETLLGFLADQVAHVVILLATAWWTGGDLVERLPALDTYRAVALHIAAVAFLATGGAVTVRLVLAAGVAWRPSADGTNAGRTIGILERFLVYAFAVAGQWAAVALVFAAKSIARFDELKERPFAEYYLVGTLASLLVAVVAALAVHLLR